MGQSDVRVPLFVFGTLQDRELLANVLSRDISDLRFTPGTVDGFGCRRVRGESYPILVPQPGNRIRGLLVEGLTAADVARLVFFESDYALSALTVEAAGRTVSALVFRHTDALADSGEAWSLATWRAFDKPFDLIAAGRWMAAYQDNDAAAALLPAAA